MTYNDAMSALRAGKRVRRAAWERDTWWALSDDGELRMFRPGGGDHYCYPRDTEKLAVDWQAMD